MLPRESASKFLRPSKPRDRDMSDCDRCYDRYYVTMSLCPKKLAKPPNKSAQVIGPKSINPAEPKLARSLTLVREAQGG